MCSRHTSRWSGPAILTVCFALGTMTTFVQAQTGPCFEPTRGEQVCTAQPDCDGDGTCDADEIFRCEGDPACGDCNNNCIPDGCDITAGTSKDCNLNGIPDECECPGPMVYISNTDSDQVWVVDMATAAVVAVVPVGSDPRGIDISPDNSRVYVANRFDLDRGSVSVIDTATNTVVQTIDLASSPLVTTDEPYDVVVSPDGQWLYVAMKNGGSNGTVVVVDLPGGIVVKEVILDSNASPEGIVVTPDGQKVYVAGRGSMYMVDVSTPAAAAPGLPVGLAERELVVSPDGAWVYANNNAVRTSDDAAFGTGESSEERGIAISPDGRFLYSTRRNSVVKVVEVDLSGGTPVTTLVTNIEDVTMNQFQSYGIDLTDQGLLGVVSFRGSNMVRIFDAKMFAFIGQPILMQFTAPGQDPISGRSPRQLVIAHAPDDCNNNGFADHCDIALGCSLDCNNNGIPDECDPDCDGDGVPDDCDLTPETEPPVITGCPQSISGSLDANCGFPAPDLQVDATDNCTATENLVSTTDPADLTNLGVGENTVTVTVTDEAGNSTSCTVMITIDIGACDQGGGNPPPPQPVPCDPSSGGINILLSLLFHAPVCGVGCPLMIMLTVCGMLSLKARIRRRRWPN